MAKPAHEPVMAHGGRAMILHSMIRYMGQVVGEVEKVYRRDGKVVRAAIRARVALFELRTELASECRRQHGDDDLYSPRLH